MVAPSCFDQARVTRPEALLFAHIEIAQKADSAKVRSPTETRVIFLGLQLAPVLWIHFYLSQSDAQREREREGTLFW